MVTRLSWILGIVALAAPVLLAQEGRVGGPLSGFVFDRSTHALRPIQGIPGAATIGDPLDPGFEMMLVYVAPQQDSVLAVTADGFYHFFRITAGTVSQRIVEGLSSSPERVAYSPNGTAVALYAAGRVQMVKGLPDSPAIAGTLSLATRPNALAISDDGAYLLSANEDSVRLLGTAGEDLKIMDAASGAMVAFAPASHDAAVNDSVAGLLWFRDVAGSSQRTVLASGDDGVASPVGLAFSADTRKLFAASSTAQSVTSFDLKTGARTLIPCNCAPAGLTRMGSVFRLNDLSSEPLWLLDASAAEPRIVFVPALRQAAANRSERTHTPRRN